MFSSFLKKENNIFNEWVWQYLHIPDNGTLTFKSLIITFLEMMHSFD